MFILLYVKNVKPTEPIGEVYGFSLIQTLKIHEQNCKSAKM